jgi:hypothetical protein
VISSRFRSVELKLAHMIVGPGSIALGFISDDKPTVSEARPSENMQLRTATSRALQIQH